MRAFNRLSGAFEGAATTAEIIEKTSGPKRAQLLQRIRIPSE